MGRARFMFYPWVFFSFRRFVGDYTQTSLGHTSNDATYGVYSCKDYTANLWILYSFFNQEIEFVVRG